jgi:hypothetical protein
MTNEPSSPVCYSADADDAYMGYATAAEVTTLLNELLEAERAGARVALEGRVAGDAAYTELMREVHADEARWCSMLSRHIRRLGGSPSSTVGTFHQKAMAIADPLDRLAFLNRGQDWVVRKLKALVPRVRDDGLHRDLHAMLASHGSNIEKAEAVLRTARSRRADNENAAGDGGSPG